MKTCPQILKMIAGRNQERTRKKQNRQQTAGTYQKTATIAQ